MECREIREKIFEYIEHNLSQKEVFEFEEHMQNCKDCQEEYEQREKIMIRLKNLKDVEPPKNLKNKIMENVIKEQSKRKIVNFKRYSLIAASFLIFIVGYIFNNKSLNINTTNEVQEPIQNNISRSLEPVPFNEEETQMFNEEINLPYIYEKNITLEDDFRFFEHYITIKENQKCNLEFKNNSDNNILIYIENIDGEKISNDYELKTKNEHISINLNSIDEKIKEGVYVINIKSESKNNIEAYFKAEIN